MGSGYQSILYPTSPSSPRTFRSPGPRVFPRGGYSVRRHLESMRRDCCHFWGAQKEKSPETTAKLITTCIALLEQYFGWPYQPSSGFLFCNICTPEEGWYSQPKYCSKKAIHCTLLSALQYSLDFFFFFLLIILQSQYSHAYNRLSKLSKGLVIKLGRFSFYLSHYARAYLKNVKN